MATFWYLLGGEWRGSIGGSAVVVVVIVVVIVVGGGASLFVGAVELWIGFRGEWLDWMCARTSALVRTADWDFDDLAGLISGRKLGVLGGGGWTDFHCLLGLWCGVLGMEVGVG